MSSMISCGGRPSTVQPMFCEVPKISLQVPLNSRAIERGRNVRAMLIMSSIEMLPLCLTVVRKTNNNQLIFCWIPMNHQNGVQIEWIGNVFISCIVLHCTVLYNENDWFSSTFVIKLPNIEYLLTYRSWPSFGHVVVPSMPWWWVRQLMEQLRWWLDGSGCSSTRWS